MFFIMGQNKSFFAFAYQNIQEKNGEKTRILKDQHLHSYNDSYEMDMSLKFTNPSL